MLNQIPILLRVYAKRNNTEVFTVMDEGTQTIKPMIDIYQKGQVKVCSKNVCVNATGQYAEIITAAVVITIIMIGVAALIKAAN